LKDKGYEVKVFIEDFERRENNPDHLPKILFGWKRVTIIDYKPDSHGVEDYLALCMEIVGRGRHKMKKILLIIIYLSGPVNKAIRDLAEKYKARATARL
jgi:hypothetical protein